MVIRKFGAGYGNPAYVGQLSEAVDNFRIDIYLQFITGGEDFRRKFYAVSDEFFRERRSQPCRL